METNFQDIDRVYIDKCYRHPKTGEIDPEFCFSYKEDETQRRISESGLLLCISFELTGSKVWMDPGEKHAKFEVKDDTIFISIDDQFSGAQLVEIAPNSYKVDASDSHGKFYYCFSFELKTYQMTSEDEQNEDCVMVEPMGAKDTRSRWNEITTKIASRDVEFIDFDGEPRLIINYLTNRKGQIEIFDAVPEEELSEIQCIHHCTRSELKKHWTTASCGIVFNFAYVFDVTVDGEDITLILRRSPEDKHYSDEFSINVLESFFATNVEVLEDERHDEIIQYLDRIEKSDEIIRRLERIEKKMNEKTSNKSSIIARRKQVQSHE